MASNPAITNLKIELGEIPLKEIILKHYMHDSEYNPEDYDQYFYLAEDGSPQFVIEQKPSNVAVTKNT